MNGQETVWQKRRRRISEIIEVGSSADFLSRGYDIFSTVMLLINLTTTVLYTFDYMEESFGPLLLAAEAITVAFFAVDYKEIMQIQI